MNTPLLTTFLTLAFLLNLQAFTWAKTSLIQRIALTEPNNVTDTKYNTVAGEGITVGIADAGAEINHMMLKGQITMTFNAFDGSSDITDPAGHGTFIASEIVGTTTNGSMYEGIAPKAKLAVAKIFNHTKQTNNTYSNLGVDWLINQAQTPIISLSITSTQEVMAKSISNGITHDILFTIAAGNKGAAQSAWPARFAKESWANGQIIVVGSAKKINGEWQLSSFSNRPGETADWYVLAPGEHISSAMPNNTYGNMSGTSTATPIVAGQAALLKSLSPQLSAREIAQIIFQTAQRVCSDQVAAHICSARTTPDPLYGWGIINIEKSIEAVRMLMANNTLPIKVASSTFDQ